MDICTIDPASMLQRPILIAFLAYANFAHGQNFTLQSKDLGGQARNAQVYNGFGCSGGNRSPELWWTDPPEGTRSFAVTLYDPDAPSDSGWWHWLVFDLPADVRELPTGAGTTDGAALPKGAIQSITDFGKPGYGGPCPPEGHGPHRYVLTIYALKEAKLGLGPTALPALVSVMLNQASLARATIVFYYQR